MKHYIIAANLGYDEALDRVKQGFVDGILNQEDYASALRGHQALWMQRKVSRVRKHRISQLTT